jgi:hypothetical protein
MMYREGNRLEEGERELREEANEERGIGEWRI